MPCVRKIITILFFLIATPQASQFAFDSLFEPIIRPLDLLPDYYMRFDLSTFALHRDAFFKRQYLAQPHPDLEFCFLSYKNFIASVWDVDFLFGLGEVPGNNVFTVLNVAFGIDPKIELRFPQTRITGGLAHRCFHEIDRSDFPLVWYNKLHLDFESLNSRQNTYFHTIKNDTAMKWNNRFSYKASAGYYVKEFFGLADPNKLDGNNPLIWEASGVCRYAVHRRPSWIFSLRGETTVGTFNQTGGYHVNNASNWYWHEAVGLEAYFIRGSRGGCLYFLYHLDDLPVPAKAPIFTLGNSRFSKNGLAEIGVTFFN